jgi:aspartate ammonia-lyase
MASSISRDITRLNNAINDLNVINLGAGSIGIPHYSDDKYIDSILNRINEFTETKFTFPNNYLDETRNIDEFVHLAQTLKLIAINLGKTASDIRLMASGPVSGFNEVHIPTYERLAGLNSSLASQSIPEIVNQVCFLIIGKETSITLAAEHGEMEVNAFAPIVYSLLFDCLEYMTTAFKLFREYCVDDMIVYEENCRKNIEASHGIIVALLGKVDYYTCVDIVEKAHITRKSIYDTCLEMGIMPKDKLDKLLKIENIKLK